jgi:hypothetical protein
MNWAWPIINEHCQELMCYKIQRNWTVAGFHRFGPLTDVMEAVCGLQVQKVLVLLPDGGAGEL